jgi:hypothetical protein
VGIVDFIVKKEDKTTKETSNTKTIRIECQGATTASLSELNNLQGDLKNLTEVDYSKLKSSILEFGFSFPIFMWEDGDGKKWIVDAHQRIRTLTKLQEEGYIIPPLPADRIFAKNRIEAKKKLLVLNSRYGQITESGLTEFLNEEDFEIPIEDMQEYLTFPEIDFNAEQINSEDVNKELNAEELAKELNVTCPKCGFQFKGKEGLANSSSETNPDNE